MLHDSTYNYEKLKRHFKYDMCDLIYSYMCGHLRQGDMDALLYLQML